MTNRTHLTISNTAQFICKACNRQWVENVSEYLHVPSMVELTVTCNCGYSWKTILERRRYFRKNDNFSGTYKHQLPGNKDSAGSMTVVDISRKGLKLKLDDAGNRFKKGDCLEVSFPLGKDTKTLIKRIVIVKTVFENFVGVVFSDTNHEDTDIDDYMS